MPEPNLLRLLVVSDLHAYCGDPGDKAPSSLHIVGDDHAAMAVFDQCIEALKKSGIEEVDAVFCPGDMTDRAEPEALARVWTLLHRLAEALGARLLATTGNHDLDSRGVHALDPRESLLELRPYFPNGSETSQLQYFTHYFCTDEIRGTRVLILNSSAHHGLVHDGPNPQNEQGQLKPEYNHGRVTLATVERVKSSLSATASDKVGILLTHHHPVDLPDHDSQDRSQMIEAGALLEALAADGQWLFIHGHKHRPYLQYAPGGAGSPVIFSAGSMGAVMDGEYEQAVENQFFVVELLASSRASELGMGVAGTVRAWSRDPWGTPCWRDAVNTDAMPAVSGFGWRSDPVTLSKQIRTWLRNQVTGATYTELVAEFPAFPYLIPTDLARTLDQLQRDGTCIITRDGAGNVARLDLSASPEGGEE